MDSDTDDQTGDDELIEESAGSEPIAPTTSGSKDTATWKASTGTAARAAAASSSASGGSGSSGGSDEEPEEWELLLEKIARDTATTKTLVGILLALVIVGSVVFGFLVRNNDSTKSAATTTTTSPADSTATTLESAAGKPCVAVTDPLPAGAPAVDVVIGPAPTSLVVKDIKEGTGAEVTASSTVTVNYVGVACSTGKIFDSSYSSGTPTPVSFPVSGVIPGFGKGVTGMKVGGQRLIGIPSDQAYGANGQGTIAPDEALWFVVEVTAVTG